MFSLAVIMYLFLGGCGGGLLLVTALSSLMFHRSTDRTSEATKAFETVKRYSYLVGLVVLVLAAGFLIADLGRPDRMFLLFTRPTTSLLTIGSFTILVSILVAAALVVMNFFYVSWVNSRIKKVAEVLCVVCSFLLIAYTGLYLQGIKAVAFWDSVWIPVLFILSSLSAGIALLDLITPFASGHEWLESRGKAVHVWHILILVLEAAAIVLLLWDASQDVFKAFSLELLLAPELRPWFILGTCGLGIALPLVAEIVFVVAQKKHALLPIDILCLVGVLCLRYCIVSAGLH